MTCTGIKSLSSTADGINKFNLNDVRKVSIPVAMTLVSSRVKDKNGIFTANIKETKLHLGQKNRGNTQ